VQRNLLDADNAVQILSCLRPGLYGCVDIPRPADPVKPNPKVRDATVRIFQGLSDPLHGSVLAVLEDATIRAADRAPIRNMVAEATSTVAGGLSASQRTSWLNFLALLLHHPHAAMRLLALQTMEPLLMELLAKSHEDFCKGVCSSSLWSSHRALTQCGVLKGSRPSRTAFMHAATALARDAVPFFFSFGLAMCCPHCIA
jgi:hypothetical protein